MNRSTIVFLLTLASLFLMATVSGPAVAGSEAPTVRLKESVSLSHGPLGLSDVVVGDLSETSYSLKLGSMPKPGSVKYVSRAYVIMMARNHDVPVPEFTGERTRTQVKRPSRTVKRTELKRRVKDVLRDELSQADDLNISVENVPRSLTILPGPYDLSMDSVNSYQSQRGPVWYRFTVQQKGRTIKEFRARVHVSQYRKVPVAVRRLERGTVLQPEMIEWKKKKIGTFRGGLLSEPEDVIGYELTRNIRAEDVLRQDYLQKPIVIERRDKITIRYQKKGVVITTGGEALEDGAVGDSIRVKNTSSEREVSAEVINEGLVEVSGSTTTEGNNS